MNMYNTTTISTEESNKILYTNNLGEFKDGWEWVCENNSGICYWNSKTGELMWVSDDDDNAKYSKLIKKKKTISRKIRQSSAYEN